MTLGDGIRYASRDGRNFGKALQLYIDGQPLLVLGTKDDYHNSMLEMILRDEDVPFRKERLCGDNVGPARVGERYRLAGAGLWGDFTGVLTLGQRSDSYGIGIDAEHAAQWSERYGRPIEIQQPTPRPAPERPRYEPRETLMLDEDIPF